MGKKKYPIKNTLDNVQTGKETFSCLPDTSVGQLKAKIGAKFQVIEAKVLKIIFHISERKKLGIHKKHYCEYCRGIIYKIMKKNIKT